MYGQRGSRGGRRKKWKRRYNKRRVNAARKHILETALASTAVIITPTLQSTAFNVHTDSDGTNNASTRHATSIVLTGVYLFLEFKFFAATPTASKIWRLLFIQSKMGDRLVTADFKFPTVRGCFMEEMRTQYRVLWDQMYLVNRVDIDQRLVLRKAFKLNVWQNYAETGSDTTQTGQLFLVVIGDSAVTGTTWEGHVCKYFVNRP